MEMAKCHILKNAPLASDLSLACWLMYPFNAKLLRNKENHMLMGKDPITENCEVCSLGLLYTLHRTLDSNEINIVTQS